MTEEFYSKLPIFKSLEEASRHENLVPMPDDWSVVVSDVEHSTSAVLTGRYKDVIVVAAASIIAALNSTKRKDLPYVFSGDGMTLCAPASYVPAIKTALIGTRRMAFEEFGLRLRIGAISVGSLRGAGTPVTVARYQMSPFVVQPAFSGGGLARVEALIKDPHSSREMEFDPAFKESGSADFSGLECRWEDVKSRYGETISLIVEPRGEVGVTRDGIFSDVLASVSEIYGKDEMCNPIGLSGLTLSLNPAQLKQDRLATAHGKGALAQVTTGVKLLLTGVLGKLLMRTSLPIGDTTWNNYKNRLLINTDFKRCADGVRLVLAGNTEQRERLCAALDARVSAGQLIYGLHVSDRALMTCMVFDYARQHVHFVDAADGGFTLAAKELKQRKGA